MSATTSTATRRLGDVDVFPIGLGAMPLSVSGRPDEAQAIRTIHAALDAGITLIDTADAYAADESAVGHNERLIAKALEGRRGALLVATKGGHTRRGAGGGGDSSPAHLRAARGASLRALGPDRIALYQYPRPDPDVPFADSVGALKELRDEGKVRWVGLSNVTVEQLDEARSIVEIVSVQNQLALDFPSPLEKGEVRAATDHGLAFLPWSPLGGIGKAGETSAREAVTGIADDRGVSPQQVVLAWLLHLGPTLIPIPGSRRPETIRDSARAPGLALADDEVAAITPAATG